MTAARTALPALVALLLAPSAAGAKTFEVTRHNDPAPDACKPRDCSLREAIRAANNRPGRDVVLLPDRRPRYNLTRANVPALADEDLSQVGDLDVTDPLTLRHPGRGRATVDANGIDRAFEIQATTVVKRIKVTGGGNVSVDPPRAGSRRTSVAGSGGGFESHAKLALIRSAVVGNTGSEQGGGINVEPTGEPGDPAASLRLVRSIVARNETIQGSGGGIMLIASSATIARSRIVRNRAENSAGGIVAGYDSSLRMSRTTVAGNRGVAAVGGVYLYESSGSIKASTISGNSTGPTGGIGGVHVTDGFAPSSLTIINSTIAGNEGAEGSGGVRATGTMADVTLRNVTVARNDGDSDDDGGDGGGGVVQRSGATFTVVNSLIALNRVASALDDCDGGFASVGGNLLTTIPLTCEGFDPDVGNAFLNTNPKIGRLKRNGGPTQTIALKRGSAAIGKAVEDAAPNRDQRGVKRDRRPDIGAYERRRRR